MENDRIKHLEFIQGVITRLNTNSFQIKSWAVTIIAAVLALFASTKKTDFILIGIFPTFLFWIMDAYCLRQERKFRGLYNDVARITKESNNIKSFDMNTDSYHGGIYSFWTIMWTKTIWIIYFLIIIFLVISFILLKDCFANDIIK